MLLDDEGRMTVAGAFYCTLVIVFISVVLAELLHLDDLRERVLRDEQRSLREKAPPGPREDCPCQRVPVPQE